MYILWNTDGCCSIKRIVLAIGIGIQMGGSEKTPQIMQTQTRVSRVKRGLMSLESETPRSQVL